jgi:phosphopantetheine binding protein
MDKGAHFYRCDFQARAPRDLRFWRHGVSLEIVLCETAELRAISRTGSPASNLKNRAPRRFAAAIGLAAVQIVTPIGVDDDFFDLGGDSITAIQLQSRSPAPMISNCLRWCCSTILQSAVSLNLFAKWLTEPPTRGLGRRGRMRPA